MKYINNIFKLSREYGIDYSEENAEGKATFFDRNNNNKELTRKVYAKKGDDKYVYFFGIKWFFA